MKKLLFALFAAVFAVSIIGCSNSSGGDSPAEQTPPAEPTMQETPLTLEAIAAGTITLTNPWSTLKYKKNGSDFVNVTAGANTITVAAGDKVAFYADGSANTDSTYLKIGCSADCFVYGNVMSLLSSSNFKNAVSISKEYAFAGLFYENTHIKKHTQKALVLPATTLASVCYGSMFYGCTGLTSAPALPATTLAARCYFGMFSGCISLTSAPALPATTLADYCYSSMFSGCTSLASAPALSATTLAASCYSSMFSGCTSLPSAPALPATTLAESCYVGMFYGCTSLSSVTCLATDISAGDCTVNWLHNVASSGTFKKASSMTSWTRDADGIPSGWTVTNYSAQ